MKRMLLAGEAMGLFIAGEEGSLSNVSHFSSAIAGAEYNVAVGLTRLEYCVSYLTKVGDDPFGEKIRNALTLQGIDTSLVQTDASHATGFMFKGKTAKGDPDIAYFRKGSAASTLSAADVDAIDFSSFDAVHVTGILAGISSSACEAAEAGLCRKHSCKRVSLIRSKRLQERLFVWRRSIAETKSVRAKKQSVRRVQKRLSLFLSHVAAGNRDCYTETRTKNKTPSGIGGSIRRNIIWQFQSP
ncbi:hypothetical protein H6A12_04410 [Phocea massiliensis]|uniref:Carbohydrate kinase PfkB domain-containing protein n=1 Tax=Merdimmobilis hominis TaxID=2897707 RepID=A0A939BEA0_9FIRM|nr:PfkB family carbohydrate kinase [Merdimmobilis hominis]MBM6920398.1 hypothetical protein [Merdimmobilis hominis]